MPMPERRVAKRAAPAAPMDLRVCFECRTIADFGEQFSGDLSRSGMFVRTRDLLPVGQAIRLDLRLGDGVSFLEGDATVFWTRDCETGRADNEPGMGVRFDRLTPQSQRTLSHLLTEKAER